MIALIWFNKTSVDQGEWSTYPVLNKICKIDLFIRTSPLPLIYDILFIKHSSDIFTWILLFSLVCFSPLLAGRFLDFQMTQNR
jgi:hypothetical protein